LKHDGLLVLFLSADVLFDLDTTIATGDDNPDEGVEENAGDTRDHEDALPIKNVLPEVGEKNQDKGNTGATVKATIVKTVRATIAKALMCERATCLCNIF
jgi:hypothetical protein